MQTPWWCQFTEPLCRRMPGYKPDTCAWVTPGYTGLHRVTLGYTGLHWVTLGCSSPLALCLDREVYSLVPSRIVRGCVVGRVACRGSTCYAQQNWSSVCRAFHSTACSLRLGCSFTCCLLPFLLILRNPRFRQLGFVHHFRLAGKQAGGQTGIDATIVSGTCWLLDMFWEDTHGSLRPPQSMSITVGWGAQCLLLSRMWMMLALLCKLLYT